jgi:hypothetical protein
MAYNVIGADGKEYGPVEVDGLKVWFAEGRLTADSQVKDFMTGRVMKLSEVPSVVTTNAPPAYGLPPQQAPTSYPRPQSTAFADDSSPWPLIGIGLRCILALGLFFFFRYAGLITAAYGVIYAVRLKSQAGHRYANLALIVSIATLAIVLVGWMFRFGNAMGRPTADQAEPSQYGNPQ